MNLNNIKDNSYSKFINGLKDNERLDFVNVKRFSEIYNGNPKVREQIDLGTTFEDLGIVFSDKSISMETLKTFFSVNTKNRDLQADIHPIFRVWKRYVDESKKFRDEIVETGNTQGFFPEYDDWREKQKKRTAFELGLKGTGIIHAPLAIELSDGCSVGCWFCGISADKFKGHFSLNENGKQEWRDTLVSIQKVLGTSMKAGFCYWGTDPLDNPDYVDFIKIYHDVVGVVPQTTTAIALKNIELTKKVLNFSDLYKDTPNRFSVLTSSILDKIHRNFTAEELIGVELVLQNVGAQLENKSGAGRAFVKENEKKFFSDSKKKKFDTVQSDSTIACVSGFLLNIVKKNIKLVSPTAANSKWKDGFIVFEERNYEDPNDLHIIIKEMILNQLYGNINKDLKFKLHNNIKLDDGFIVSPNVKLKVPFSNKFSEIIMKGGVSPLKIVQDLNSIGEDPRDTLRNLNFLWNQGYIQKNNEE